MDMPTGVVRRFLSGLGIFFIVGYALITVNEDFRYQVTRFFSIQNAALYYTDVLDELTVPEDPRFWPRVYAVVDDGWPEILEKKDAFLLRALSQNQPAITTLDLALNLKYCDFYMGRDVPDFPLRNLLRTKVVRVGELMLLRARRYQSEAADDLALEDVLRAMKVAYHLYQDPNMGTQILSIDLLESALHVLVDLLRAGALSEDALDRVLDEVDEWESVYIPIADVLAGQTELFKSKIRLMSADFFRRYDEDYDRYNVNLFQADIEGSGRKIVISYFGLLNRYLERPKKAYLKRFEGVNSLLQYRVQVKSITPYPNVVYDYFDPQIRSALAQKHRIQYNRISYRMASEVAAKLFVIPYATYIPQYASVGRVFDSIRVLAEIKKREIDNGKV